MNWHSNLRPGIGDLLIATSRVIWIIAAVWSFLLNLVIVYNVGGLSFAILSVIIAPIFIVLAPFYAGFVWGNWFPLIIGVGGILASRAVAILGVLLVGNDELYKQAAVKDRHSLSPTHASHSSAQLPHRILAVQIPVGTERYPVTGIQRIGNPNAWIVMVSPSALVPEITYSAIIENGEKRTPGLYTALNYTNDERAGTKGIFRLTQPVA